MEQNTTNQNIIIDEKEENPQQKTVNTPPNPEEKHFDLKPLTMFGMNYCVRIKTKCNNGFNH